MSGGTAAIAPIHPWPMLQRLGDVRRGLATGGFDQVRLMLRQESALRHFQRLAYGALG